MKPIYIVLLSIAAAIIICPYIFSFFLVGKEKEKSKNSYLGTILKVLSIVAIVAVGVIVISSGALVGVGK